MTHCSEPDCCNRTQWPHCQQTAGMPTLLTPTAVNNPACWEDDTPWRNTLPTTD